MKATDIMHPEDQKAIGALKKIPFIDEMAVLVWRLPTRKYIEVRILA